MDGSNQSKKRSNYEGFSLTDLHNMYENIIRKDSLDNHSSICTWYLCQHFCQNESIWKYFSFDIKNGCVDNEKEDKMYKHIVATAMYFSCRAKLSNDAVELMTGERDTTELTEPIILLFAGHRDYQVSLSLILKATNNDVRYKDLIVSCKECVTQCKWLDRAFMLHLDSLEADMQVSNMVFGKYKKLYEHFFNNGCVAGDCVSQSLSGISEKDLKFDKIFQIGWLLYLLCVENFGLESQTEMMPVYLVLLCILDCVIMHAPETKLNKDARKLRQTIMKSIRPIDRDTVNALLPSQGLEALERSLSEMCILSIVSVDYVSTPMLKSTLARVTEFLGKRSKVRYLAVDNNTPLSHSQCYQLVPEMLEMYLNENLKELNSCYEALYIRNGGIDKRTFFELDERLDTPSKRTRPSPDHASPVHSAKQPRREMKSPTTNRNLVNDFESQHVSQGGGDGHSGGVMASPQRIVAHENHTRQLRLSQSLSKLPSSSSFSSAIHAEGWLRDLVKATSESGEDREGVPPSLSQYLNDCSVNPTTSMMTRLKSLVALVPFPGDTRSARQNDGKLLYFHVLEAMLRGEEQRINISDFSTLLHNDSFHRSLLALSMQVIIHVHRIHQLVFPFILDCYDLPAFHFFKVIEGFQRRLDLPQEIKCHLDDLEATVLERLVWVGGSPLFTYLQNHRSESQSTKLHDMARSSVLARRGGLESPSNLFPPGSGTVESESIPASTDVNDGTPQPTSLSLGFLYTKLWFLSSRRIHDLSLKLALNSDTIQLVWSLLKCTLIDKFIIMKDRELDQILLCCIYGVCKAANISLPFKKIIECYKELPRASSDVYRHILITDSVDGRPCDKEYGDIIKFYNTIFIKDLKKYIIQQSVFSNDGVNGNEGVVAVSGPVPQSSHPPMDISPSSLRPPKNIVLLNNSPSRRASTMTTPPLPDGSNVDGAMTPRTRHLYSIGESPSRELQFINRRINGPFRGRPSIPRPPPANDGRPIP